MNLITNSSLPLVLLILFSAIHLSNQLECYACQNQEDNKSKCVETVKTCDLSQDNCLTEVRWGGTPYWALTSQKQYYISKRCATKTECQDAISDTNQKCDRIGYNDWNCTTCCSGDKCNYYVTLGTVSIKPSNFLILSGTIISYVLFMSHSTNRRMLAILS